MSFCPHLRTPARLAFVFPVGSRRHRLTFRIPDSFHFNSTDQIIYQNIFYVKKFLLTCEQFFLGGWSLFCFLLFRAILVACGASQARGWIRATAAGLHHSHSNARSLTHWVGPGIEPCNLMVPSQICFRCTTTGTLCKQLFIDPFLKHKLFRKQTSCNLLIQLNV